MKKTNRYIRLNSKMFEDMKVYGKENYCNADNVFDMSNTMLVQKILDEAFLHCLNYKKANRKISVDKVISTELENKAKKGKPISFRLSDEMCILFKKFYKTDNLSFAFRCAIRDVLNNNCRPKQLAPTEKVRCMIGQKNDEMTELLKEIFDDIATRRTINGYHEPFAGTANVYLHANMSSTTTLNDNSKLGCNLLNIIKFYPVELKEEILSLTISEEGFKRAKEELKHINITCKSTKIRAAALFFFLCNCSVRAKAESYSKKVSFLEMLDAISVVHERLQNAEIKNSNALYYLNKLMNATNQLIYCDPPYLGTEAYYRNQNSKNEAFTSHKSLCNKVIRLSKNNVCIVSYRVTASKKMALDNIPNKDKPTKSEKNFRIRQEKRKVEKKIKQQLDSLYLNKGFHIAFKTLKRTKHQVEIIISSEPFVGSKPYTTPLCKKEVA